MNSSRSIPFVILSVAIGAVVLTSLGFIHALHKDPVPEVKVAMTCTNGGCKMSATTDAYGHFSFVNVADGEYSLSCSYAECARAINTKGTGAIVREAANVPEFQIELQPTEGASFAMWPHMHQIATHAREGKPRDVVVTNGPMLFTLSKEFDPTEPLAKITVSGKRTISGHAYAMYSVQK